MTSDDKITLLLFIRRIRQKQVRESESLLMAHAFIVLYDVRDTKFLWKLYSKAPEYLVRSVYTAKRKGIITYDEFSVLLSLAYELSNSWDSRIKEMHSNKKENNYACNS